jgi:hypothetical protein
VAQIILKKSRQLMSDLSRADVDRLAEAGRAGLFLGEDARRTPALSSNSVDLVVTSPPFLDVVQYAQDNWLRFWFNGIDAEETGGRMSMHRTLDEWSEPWATCLSGTVSGGSSWGWVAFEVGEVRKGKVRLEEAVVPVGVAAGFGLRGF